MSDGRIAKDVTRENVAASATTSSSSVEYSSTYPRHQYQTKTGIESALVSSSPNWSHTPVSSRLPAPHDCPQSYTDAQRCSVSLGCLHRGIDSRSKERTVMSADADAQTAMRGALVQTCASEAAASSFTPRCPR